MSSRREIVALGVASLALACAVSAALYLHTFDGQVTGFFKIGAKMPHSPLLDGGAIQLTSGPTGYDGQFFLTLGLDPFLRHEGSAAALDNPRYRHRRIFYPLLGYLLGLGSPRVVPYTLVLINVLCIPLLILLVAASVPNRSPPGPSRWTALLALGVPGIWFVLSVSTADLLGSTLLVAALAARARKRAALGAAALALACLTRETYLLVWVALVAATALKDRSWRAPGHLAWAGLPAAVWNLVVIITTPGGTSGVAENFGLPLAGVIHKLGTLLSPELRGGFFLEALLFPLLLATAVVVVLSVVRPVVRPGLAGLTARGPDHGELAGVALPGVLLLCFSTLAILEYRGGYVRIYQDLTLILLLDLPSPALRRAKLVVLALSSCCAAGMIASRIAG